MSKFYQWWGHGEGFGGGFEPPLSSGATHEVCAEPMRKYWGRPYPHPLNVAPANTLVLVAHLVTFSESQWNQFHPRAKKPTASWGSTWPPQLLCPCTPLGTPLHTPRHAPLVSHFLQNSARTNSQNDHLIITLVTNHYICNKCNNVVNFYICTKLALLLAQLWRQCIYVFRLFLILTLTTVGGW